MPIRFRCAYCNQLLGIAKRKSGTVVRCPTCAGQVVVPNLDQEPAEEDPVPAPAPPGPAAFDGSEIDKLLEGAAGDQPSIIGNAVRETMRPLVAPADALRFPPAKPAPAAAIADHATRAPGIFLSPAKATLLSVLAVIALAVTFGVGLMFGLFIQSIKQ